MSRKEGSRGQTEKVGDKFEEKGLEWGRKKVKRKV